MKPYFQPDIAADILDRTATLEYPNSERNLVDHPPIGDLQLPDGTTIKTARPQSLVTEAVGYFDDGQTIIDVGCGFATSSLYLAAQGHKVLAVDPDPTGLEWARERARAVGIPNANIDFKKADLFELPNSTKYGGVLALMMLHFLPSEDVSLAVRKLQSITQDGGINVVSAYTTDNPLSERTRGLNHFFGPGSLAKYYGDWRKLRSTEGVLPRIINREHVTGDKAVIIPTIAEIIAKKVVASTTTKPATYMNANREVVELR